MHTKYIVTTSYGVHIMEMWRKGEYSKNVMDEVVVRVMASIQDTNHVCLYVMRYSKTIRVGVVGSDEHCIISYTQHEDMCVA